MFFLATEPWHHRGKKKKARAMWSGPVNPPFEEVEETTSAKMQRISEDARSHAMVLL
jgi:hypothetical protein